MLKDCLLLNNSFDRVAPVVKIKHSVDDLGAVIQGNDLKFDATITSNCQA